MSNLRNHLGSTYPCLQRQFWSYGSNAFHFAHPFLDIPNVGILTVIFPIIFWLLSPSFWPPGWLFGLSKWTSVNNWVTWSNYVRIFSACAVTVWIFVCWSRKSSCQVRRSCVHTYNRTWTSTTCSCHAMNSLYTYPIKVGCNARLKDAKLIRMIFLFFFFWGQQTNMQESNSKCNSKAPTPKTRFWRQI